MRQAWVARHGGPEVFEIREAPDPEAEAGKVRIRVEAAGVNFADVLARIGLYPDAPKPPCVLRLRGRRRGGSGGSGGGGDPDR